MNLKDWCPSHFIEALGRLDLKPLFLSDFCFPPVSILFKRENIYKHRGVGCWRARTSGSVSIPFKRENTSEPLLF